MKCLYCNKEVEIGDSSLEHGIPTFLGGKYAPDFFKSGNVHTRCNNLLGRYVDASFARSWFVSSAIQNCAMVCYDSNDTTAYAIPLQCMGISPFTPPDMSKDEVCESWIGPLGEHILLIRKHDEAFYWYSGGDPVLPKQKQISRAYFFFSTRSSHAPQIVWDSFQTAFEDEKTKKIMCTQIEGADPATIGFSNPDALDEARIAYFKEQTSISSGDMKNSLSFNLRFDLRFLCKLGTAVAYSFFGEQFLNSTYAKELRDGVWYRYENPNQEPIDLPQIKGVSAFGFDDARLKKLLGMKGAVVIVLTPFPEGIAMLLMIGDQHFGSIKIADVQEVDQEKIQGIGAGKVFLIFRFLKNFLELPLPNYIAHKLGNYKSLDLAEIEEKISRNEGYFQNLK